MGLLETYLETFNEKEKTDLVKFVAYKSRNKKRIDAKLLELLLTGTERSTEELIKCLYSLPKKSEITSTQRNKYYQWRSILTELIEEFCTQKSAEDEPILKIFKPYQLAHYLFRRKQYDHAFTYLSKAEALAQQNEDFSMLLRIYAMMLNFAWTQKNIDMDRLLEKIKTNERKQHIEFRCNQVYNELNIKLMKIKASNHTQELDALLREAKTLFSEADEIHSNAKTFLKFTMSLYVVLEEMNAYQELLEHMTNAFQFMKSNQMFRKLRKSAQLEFLTFVMRAAVISRDFEMADLMRSELNGIYRDFSEDPVINIRSYGIEYVHLVCIGKLPEAKKKINGLFEMTIVQSQMKSDTLVYYHMYGNLMSSNFFSGHYAVAKKHCQKLVNVDKAIRKQLGILPQINVFVADILNYFELQDYEQVLNKITLLKNRFKAHLKTPGIDRLFRFLEIVNGLAKNLGELDQNILDMMNSFLKKEKVFLLGKELIPLEPFILAKRNNSAYYDELLTVIQRKKKQ